MIKTLLRWMAIGATFAVVMLVVGPWWVVARDVVTGAPYRDYLEDHVVRLDLSEADTGFAFPASYYDNRLFLLGEIHGAAKAQEIDLALMRHLHGQVGLRWLMAELDYTQAERFNRYLDTGDPSVVRPVFDSWLESSTQWGNQEHFEKLQAIRAFNETLPEERRLRYFGVDRIQDVDNAVAWLADVLEAQAADRDADSLQDADGVADLLRSSRAFDGDLADLLASAERVEGELNRDARHIVDGLRRSAEGSSRYDAIQANIRTMVQDFGVGDDEPLYGFWGIFHTLKATVNGTGVPLASRLEASDLPFADGIVSAVMVYSDASMNMPTRMIPEPVRPGGRFFDAPMSQDNPYLQYMKGIRDLKVVAGAADAAVFQMDADGSPYRGTDRLLSQTGLMTRFLPFEIDAGEERPASYVILVNGSRALSPFEG